MMTLQKLLFLLFFLPFIVFAQSPQCLNFTGSGYLGNPVVQGNNVWFPASGALVKMDKTTGAQTVYRPDNSNMVGMEVSCLALSPNGTLWGGGKYGFWKFDGTSFTNYAITSTGDTIADVAEMEWDAAGNMYVYGVIKHCPSFNHRVDVLVFDGTLISRLNLPYSANYGYYNPNILCVKDNGEIYVSLGSIQQGDSCYRYNGSSWSQLALPSTNHYFFVKNTNQEIIALPNTFSLLGATIYTLSGNTWVPTTCTNPPAVSIQILGGMMDSNNDIYMYGFSQLIKLTGSSMTWQNYGAVTPNQDKTFYGIAKEGNGDFWLTYINNTVYQTGHYELVKYVSGQWVGYNYENDIFSTGHVKIDNFNRKWCYNYFGMSLFNGASWDIIPYPAFKSLTSYEVFTFDKYGDLWVVFSDLNTSNLELYKFDGTTWTFIKLSNGYESIAIDDLGRMCVGGSMHMDYFDGNSWQTFLVSAFQTGILNGDLLGIAADSNNLFWLTSGLGELATFDGLNFTLQDTLPLFTLFNGDVQTRFDDINRLWITSLNYGKIYILDGANVIEYSRTTIPSLDSAKVLGGCRDLNGNDWISTDKGLYKKNGNTWINYNVYNSSIGSNNTSNLYVDNANNLWFSGNGVTVFNESGIGLNSLQTNYNTAEGNIYHDANGNGLKDTLENNLYSQQVLVLPENIYRYSNNSGNYSYLPTVGNHTLTISPYPNWQLTSDSVTYHVAGGVARDSLDFGLQAISPHDSISVSLYAGQTRCDTEVPYWIYYKNKGTTTLSGSVVFMIDPLTSLVSSYPAYNSNTTYTYTWNFQNLLPFQTQGILVNVMMPNANFMGTAIQMDVVANAATVSDMAQLIDTLACAFDPNDKTAFLPAGTSSGNFVLQNTPFTYMIRFQNTGNDVAFNVTIEDTLDANWDMSTFQVLDYSHPLETNYTENGIVRFHFPNIMLPDSGTNEPASHGFVSYYVKPKPNLTELTQIENTAFIYFDSNPPVVTNTTSHTMVSTLGIVDENEWKGLQWYPNPMDEYGVLTYSNPNHEPFTFKLMDVSGKVVYQSKDTEGKIEVSNNIEMAGGMYLFSLSNGEKSFWGKWLKR